MVTGNVAANTFIVAELVEGRAVFALPWFDKLTAGVAIHSVRPRQRRIIVALADMDSGLSRPRVTLLRQPDWILRAGPGMTAGRSRVAPRPHR